MGTLQRLLWLFILLTAGAGTAQAYHVSGASGCYTSVGGHYHCPGGYYWHSGYRDWGYYGHRHYSYHYRRHDWRWTYYRPSLYRDYYTYAVFDAYAVKKPVRVSGASAMPSAAKPAADTACEQANADLRYVTEKRRLSPDSDLLRTAEHAARDKALQECVPPWMQKAAGLSGAKPADTPVASSAL